MENIRHGYAITFKYNSTQSLFMAISISVLQCHIVHVALAVIDLWKHNYNDDDYKILRWCLESLIYSTSFSLLLGLI